MTVDEFSREFDIQYDSIASLGAPGLDEYEKSVFLTRAQLQIVKEVNGRYNKYKKGFEGNDKRRADLQELVVDYSAKPEQANNGLVENSYTVKLPSKCFLVKYEAGKKYTNKEHIVKIIPMLYDEFHDSLRNPYRRVSKDKGYRLDKQSELGIKVVELVLYEPIDTYQIRYIKYPSPIILTDLGGVSSETLSIDGIVSQTECELHEELHPEILDRAVLLATARYKPEHLSIDASLSQLNN